MIDFYRRLVEYEVAQLSQICLERWGIPVPVRAIRAVEARAWKLARYFGSMEEVAHFREWAAEQGSRSLDALLARYVREHSN